VKKWYAVLFIFFAAFLVFRFVVPRQAGPSLGPMQPGNPVDIALGRSALVVEGDAADPLKEVRLFRVSGVEKSQVLLDEPLVTPNRVLYFFPVEKGARYLAEVITRHRTRQVELEATPSPSPIEVLRARLDGVAPRVAFAADGRSVFVQTADGAAREFRISDGMEVTPPGTPPPNAGGNSADGRLLAMVMTSRDEKGAEKVELIVMH
jgi:hypothetical protein